MWSLEHIAYYMDRFTDYINSLAPWTEVRVKWHDAHAPHSGWHEVDEYVPEEAVAITLGRIWHNCQKDYLTVVGTMFEPEEGIVKTVGDINHIPLGWITGIEVITKAHNEKE